MAVPAIIDLSPPPMLNMNSPVNPSIDTFPTLGKAPSAPSLEQTPPSSTESTAIAVPERKQPIPPPNHPRQYRAIGLVYGHYQQSEGHLTQGVLTREDGTEIEAVLLGRMMSLIKNHIDLAEPHLWVVYPHIRQEDDHLHLQIVGIWEPETLSQEANPITRSPEEPSEDQESGYFSIRGEVVFAIQETGIIIVKIRQAPKVAGERPKFFKIKLNGVLPDKPVSRFWDLHVQLIGDTLTLQSANDLGFAASKKPVKRSERERSAMGAGKGKGTRNSGNRPHQANASGEKRSGSPLPKPLPKPSKGDRASETP